MYSRMASRVSAGGRCLATAASTTSRALGISRHPLDDLSVRFTLRGATSGPMPSRANPLRRSVGRLPEANSSKAPAFPRKNQATSAQHLDLPNGPGGLVRTPAEPRRPCGGSMTGYALTPQKMPQRRLQIGIAEGVARFQQPGGMDPGAGQQAARRPSRRRPGERRRPASEKSSADAAPGRAFW